MLYEFATLDIAIGSAPEVAKGVSAWCADGAAKGTLLGAFLSDVGQLNQVLVLRSFSDAAAVATERQRALHSANPFNAGKALDGLSMDTYAPFPFVEPAKPGALRWRLRDPQLRTENRRAAAADGRVEDSRCRPACRSRRWSSPCTPSTACRASPISGPMPTRPSGRGHAARWSPGAYGRRRAGRECLATMHSTLAIPLPGRRCIDRCTEPLGPYVTLS